MGASPLGCKAVICCSSWTPAADNAKVVGASRVLLLEGDKRSMTGVVWVVPLDDLRSPESKVEQGGENWVCCFSPII